VYLKCCNYIVTLLLTKLSLLFDLNESSRDIGEKMSGDKLLILIVEDDESLLKMMQNMLELEGYEILTAQNGATAISTVETSNPGMVLLDIGLPDMDGLTVCKCIRRFSKVPIIMVTGKTEVTQKVEGLYAGADDYLTKPFAYGELIARINVLIRRTGNSENPVRRTNFKLLDLTIDFNKQVVTKGDERIELSNTEYRILAYLAQHNGNTVIPGELLKEVWGDEYSKSVHLLQVNISRLRQKLHDNSGQCRYIETRPGHGYSLVAE
jgi:DNA-binding response OmpR family regulator